MYMLLSQNKHGVTQNALPRPLNFIRINLNVFERFMRHQFCCTSYIFLSVIKFRGVSWFNSLYSNSTPLSLNPFLVIAL